MNGKEKKRKSIWSMKKEEEETKTTLLQSFPFKHYQVFFTLVFFCSVVFFVFVFVFADRFSPCCNVVVVLMRFLC